MATEHGIDSLQPLQLGGNTRPIGKFGRLFPSLPPFKPEFYKLRELGEAMKDSDLDFKNVDDSGNNTKVTSGYTYLGQFIDHDISFDTTSLSARILDPNSIANFRTPALDLDSVYGLGPDVQPYLYEASQDNDVLDKFIFGMTRNDRDGTFPNDLPRALTQHQDNSEAVSSPRFRFALIPDVRNDSHIIVAQLHLALMKFHNKLVDDIHNATLSINTSSPIFSLLQSTKNRTFELARKLVIWHYQWLILNDYLPKIVNPEQLELVLNCGRDYYTNNKTAYLPIEFSIGAFRFAHSIIRPLYQLNIENSNGVGLSSAMKDLDVFTAKKNNVPLPTSWIVDWRLFFESGTNIKPNYSRLIDTKITHQLYLEETVGPIPLIVRDFIRGCKVGLPSGQQVAKYMGFTPLKPDEITSDEDGAVAKKHGFHEESPLLYYILKESMIQQEGKCLGDVGSRIVAEVIIGLLDTDKNSYLSQDKNWKPIQGDNFTMADMLKYAEVLEKPFRLLP